MNKQDLVKLVQETLEETMNEAVTALSLKAGKQYNWTMGAGPNKVTYIGTRSENPEIKAGSSVGTGFIFQFEDGKYLEVASPTIMKYIEELEPEDEINGTNSFNGNDGYKEDPWEGHDELEESKRTYEQGYKDAKAKYQKLAKAYKKLKEGQLGEDKMDDELKEFNLSNNKNDDKKSKIEADIDAQLVKLAKYPNNALYITKSAEGDKASLLRKAEDNNYRGTIGFGKDAVSGKFFLVYKKGLTALQNIGSAAASATLNYQTEAKIGDGLDDDKFLGPEFQGEPSPDTALDKIVDKIAKAIDYPAEKTIQLLRIIVKRLDGLNEVESGSDISYPAEKIVQLLGLLDKGINSITKSIEYITYKLDSVQESDQPESEEQLQESKKPVPKQTKKQPLPKPKKK